MTNSAKRLLKYLKEHPDTGALTRAICKEATCTHEECSGCPVYSPTAFKDALNNISVKEV